MYVYISKIFRTVTLMKQVQYAHMHFENMGAVQ